jgi:CheY-like chemotaxis protein
MFDVLNGKPGIECSRQFSSAEAVLAALAQSSPPDVILLDVNMGKMSGLDAIQPIKQLAGSTRVFIMTASDMGMAASHALKAGASGFFLKGEVQGNLEYLCDPSSDWSPESLQLASARSEWRGADPDLESSASPPIRQAGSPDELTGARPAEPSSNSLPWPVWVLGLLCPFLSRNARRKAL